MATTITPTEITLDDTTPTSIPIASQTAFTDASELEIAYPREGRLVLIINSTYAGANTAVIAAGEYTGAGTGALTVVTAQNGVYYVTVSSDRFKDFDGNLTVTFGTSNTGFFHAISLPY